MDNVIVYLDDAAHAVQFLLPLMTTGAGRSPTRWIVVGCAPRVTQRASKWVTNSARESWRGKWADKVFSQVLPVLQRDGDIVVTHLRRSALCEQTESLIRDYGGARVLDARRPKFDPDLQPVTDSWINAGTGILGYANALPGEDLVVRLAIK